MMNVPTTKEKPIPQAVPKSAGEGNAIPVTADNSEPVTSTTPQPLKSAGCTGIAVITPVGLTAAQIIE
jgi:hypothetical protein